MNYEEQKLMQEARIPADNWWCLPLQGGSPEYSSWEEEQMSWKHNVCIWGYGCMVYDEVSGPDATRLMEAAFVNNFKNAKPGTVKHVIACREDGKMIHDTMCLVTKENTYELSASLSLLQYLNRNGDYDVQIKAQKMSASMQVSGPKSFMLLSKLTDYDLNRIAFAHFNTEPVKLGGYDVRLVRITMSGEMGFEIHYPLEAQQALYDMIWEAGQEFGIRRIGARNHLVMHVEAGMVGVYRDCMLAIQEPDNPYAKFFREANDVFVMAGFAFPKISGSFEAKSFSDYYMSPVDLGMQRIINFNHDFLGCDALKKEIENPTRKMVTLEWNKEDILDVYSSMFSDGGPHEEINTPHYDYMEIPRDPKLPLEASTVLVDGKQVAFTTSRTYSYAYRRMISNCVIPLEYAVPGTEVTIVWGNPGHPQKNIRAVVSEHPIKPDRTRG